MEKLTYNPENQRDEWRMKATAAFHEICQGAQGTLENGNYLTADYVDELERRAEVRLYQDRAEPSSFSLTANHGKALALIELKNRLEEHGIPIERMGASDASTEETERLRAECKKK